MRTNTLAIYVYVLHPACEGADEGNLLIDVNTLALELLSKSPHVTAAEILVLKCNFDVVCTLLRLVNLCFTAHLAPIQDW